MTPNGAFSQTLEESDQSLCILNDKRLAFKTSGVVATGVIAGILDRPHATRLLLFHAAYHEEASAMLRLRYLFVLLPLLAAGCFPIELDVRDGKLLIAREEGFFVFDPGAGKAVKVAGAETGNKPVFARFSPDGKEVLTVSKTGFDARFVITPIAGGKGREVYKAENAAYVRYSPDGATIAVTRMSEKDDPAFKSKLPELYLIPAKGGAAKKVAEKIAVLFRWFSDSKRILVFELDKKDEQQSRFYGRMSVLDVTTGKTMPLAAAAVSQSSFLDLSPDNKKALFTAFEADKPGTDLTKTKEGRAKLYELDVTAGTVRKIDKEASYAIYSPDGKNVLLGTPPEGFSFESLKLEVADAGLTKFTTVAPDVFMPLALGGEGTTYPGWVDDKTVFFFVRKAVYGTEGKSMQLMTVGIDGKGRRCLQPQIDMEAIKDEK
jgi:dipeptidyl aminopeptidase/acylaminoacyl peptidase